MLVTDGAAVVGWLVGWLVGIGRVEVWWPVAVVPAAVAVKGVLAVVVDVACPFYFGLP